MLTALITGGAGFLGSHICDKLVAKGYNVICVDNFLTGKRENIAHLLGCENFALIEHDITRPIDKKLLAAKIQNLKYIFHFASPASPRDYMKYPIETMRVGAFGTYNMLELAREYGATFLLASTSEVYGDPEVIPQPEEYWGHVNPLGPRSVYDESKRFAEALSMAYHRTYGLDVRIARIFNTYGPRMRIDDGRVVSTFIVQALRGEPLTVYGDGTQTRSFCFVEDLVEGILRLANYNGLTGVVINLGNPEEITILRLACLIKELTGSTSPILFAALPKDDPKRRQPDISLARKLLEWNPKISLQEGLLRTIDYFRSKVRSL